MVEQSPAEIYLAVACAVIVSVNLGHPDRRIGQGDAAADQRRAEQVRAAAKAIYAEIAEEMEVLGQMTP